MAETAINEEKVQHCKEILYQQQSIKKNNLGKLNFVEYPQERKFVEYPIIFLGGIHIFNLFCILPSSKLLCFFFLLFFIIII